MNSVIVPAFSDVEQCVARFREDSADESGFWRTCSGCFETEDGYPNGSYPHNEAFGCTMGSGCSDCGGLGAIWDTIDYDHMALHILAEEAVEVGSAEAGLG